MVTKGPPTTAADDEGEAATKAEKLNPTKLKEKGEARASSSLEERARTFFRGIALAPMVRASTTPLRTLAIQYGADLVYTEELVDRSLFGTVRVENEALGTIDYLKDLSHLSKRTKRRLERETTATASSKNKSQSNNNDERTNGILPPVMLRIDRRVEGGKLICQIGSGEPELALKAALHVQQDVDAIDINMGCPKKFSVSGGMGAALLQDADRACRIIRTLRDNLHDTLVSCKIRLLDATNPTPTADFCTKLIQAGVHAIAIHARKPGQDSTVPALWDVVEQVVMQVKSKFPNFPILLNGDFYTRQDWTDMLARCGADGVLLGRPALYNTSIFKKPEPPLSKPEEPTSLSSPSSSCYSYDSPLLLDRTLVIQEYLRHCIRYDIHFKNAKYVVCEMMNSRRAPIERMHKLPQVFLGQQTIGLTCSCRSLREVCQLWNVTQSPSGSVDDASLQVDTTAAAPAGEHKYEDSYFLGPLHASATSSDVAVADNQDTNHQSTDELPPTKRPRLTTNETPADN